MVGLLFPRRRAVNKFVKVDVAITKFRLDYVPPTMYFAYQKQCYLNPNIVNRPLQVKNHIIVYVVNSTYCVYVSTYFKEVLKEKLD